jgi:hypothetical protein
MSMFIMYVSCRVHISVSCTALSLNCSLYTTKSRFGCQIATLIVEHKDCVNAEHGDLVKIFQKIAAHMDKRNCNAHDIFVRAHESLIF